MLATLPLHTRAVWDVSAVLKNPETYEHIRPELVGNYQRVLVSSFQEKAMYYGRQRNL